MLQLERTKAGIIVSGVTNRSQTWAESADDPLISEGKLIICGTAGIYLSALLATRHIPRAAEPGAGWTCGAGPAGLDLRGWSHWDPGRPLLAIFSGAGRSLSEPRSNRGAPAGLGGCSGGLRCPLVSRGRWHCPAPSAGAPEVPAVLPPARRCRGGAGASRPGPGSGAEPGGGAGPDGEQPLSPLLCLAPKFRSACFWTRAGCLFCRSQKIQGGSKRKNKVCFLKSKASMAVLASSNVESQTQQ